MKIEQISLNPGLYFIATPIGRARDITLHALDVLASADVLAAEDTRTLRKLMQIHGVPLNERRIVAYHDHNGPQMRPKLLQMIRDGASVAYASEAGTPLVADPGFQLGRAALEADLPVTSAPGPTAVVAALSISGLPTDRFLFAGFPPSSKGARQTWLSEVIGTPATLAIYESAKRLKRTLEGLQELGAGDRDAAICRELTKRFEEVRRGSITSLLEQLEQKDVKGEVVILLDRARAEDANIDLEGLLLGSLKVNSLKDAVRLVTEDTGLPRRQVYQAALNLDRNAGSSE